MQEILRRFSCLNGVLEQVLSCIPDTVVRNVEYPLTLHPCPMAVILVASAGHGMDLITATELLSAVKSAGGLSVAILLKPFTFEGQRRLEEVDDIASKLRECSHFYIVVEADSLLKVEVETLAEALESANNAVFVALITISFLISEMHMKLLDTSAALPKLLKSLDVLKLLESYGEAKVSFGAGYNIKTTIAQAISRCPSLCDGLKNSNGLVIFTLASASPLEENDLLAHVQIFRQITSCTCEIIFSRIHEPDLEPNLIILTLLIVGCDEKTVPNKKSFFGGLAVRFPFLSSFLGKSIPEQRNNYASSRTSDVFNLSDNMNLSDGAVDKEAESFSKELSFDNDRSCIESSDIPNQSTSGNEFQTDLVQSTEEADMETEQPGSWDVSPGYQIAQVWAKERAILSGTEKIDKLDTFTFSSHIGVKSSDQISDGSSYSDSKLPKSFGGTSRISLVPPSIPYMELKSGTGFEAIKDMYSSAVTRLKGKQEIRPRKRGLLSDRAASVLEAERDSLKSWTPILEMQYRGGTYRGRCQEGLPEGKGRLTFTDGSFYDGMWRYGKRSGTGTFCYSNGDVFQGSWRDDLIHGKGWFYFHDGGRWFANFWKNKANGEGRLYSKDGSIFFGHFSNGWRDGQSLCIDADGTRWTELWDDGVLVTRTRLDKDDETGG
ncbi:protein ACCUMULATION AND REPLICATION OF CHLOROPLASTS 3 isoform X2 [Dioscorea cayenensis subsp. rotundata]|uniref:Protein ACCUMULATION AND REPLICATION OF CHLOROPLASTS 3 isoform X2 n=1 Tax=Dioscorea cayennensis subsp. rotundata TaxID=55577 RepID=A0AB40C6M9_DIOCR|nr:protein ACCUMULATION AND REPLICATION OF CHLOROPLASTS 3 isoform X2 [Dioscorea cayenensis subsp. rotundata]